MLCSALVLGGVFSLGRPRLEQNVEFLNEIIHLWRNSPRPLHSSASVEVVNRAVLHVSRAVYPSLKLTGTLAAHRSRFFRCS